MGFNRTIFLTGFPGFIAGRLVARLADAGSQFYLLVQPAFVETAKASIEDIAAATGADLGNFVIVEGDITKPDLGIEAEDTETIRAETTDVFHLAAIYDLAVGKDLAYAVNLDGTKNVNEFVRSLPNLHRYNYVSTVTSPENAPATSSKPNSNTTQASATITKKRNTWPRSRSKS